MGKTRFTMPLITRYCLCNVLNVLGVTAIIAAAIVQTEGWSALFSLIAFVLIGASMLLYHRRESRARSEQPVMVVRVQVLDGWKEETWEQVTNKYTKAVRYYMTFQAEGGETLTMETNEATVNRYAIGARGTLRYRAGQFLSFMERDIFMSEKEAP